METFLAAASGSSDGKGLKCVSDRAEWFNKLVFDITHSDLTVAGTNWDLATQYDVFLQTVQAVNAATGSSTDQHTGSVLERRGTQERICRQTGLGNTKQQ